MRVLKYKNEYDGEYLCREFLAMKKQQGVCKESLQQHQYALSHLHNVSNEMPTVEDVKRCLPPEMGSGYFNKRLSTYRQFNSFCLSLGRNLELGIEDIHYKKKKYHIVNHEKCEV